MDARTIISALFGLLISHYTSANTACFPGVYSDGKANVVVVHKKSSDAELAFLTLNGFFGKINSDHDIFLCQPGAIHLNNDKAEPLNVVALRRTLTTFISANTQLTGELIEPLNVIQTTNPLVVMVHGSEQEPAIGNSRALLMAGMGLSVFVYDKRGTGQSKGIYTQNFELLAEDAAAAMDHARSIVTAPNKRTGFWGRSQGGWVAPLAATLTPVDFVVVSYGLIASPIEEDLDQMLLEAEKQRLDDIQRDQIRRLSNTTAKILVSDFKAGLGELEKLRKEFKAQQWINHINGEYSGAMLRMSDDKLRRVGHALFDNLELIWNYESTPAIKTLSSPVLWIIAEEDREAPAQRTLQELKILKKHNSRLTIYTFPNTDHGMYEFKELPDGSRNKIRITNGYFRLIAEWIHEKDLPYSGNGFLN